MNPLDPKPTFHELFVRDYFETTRRELEPSGVKREVILEVANERASNSLGFQVEISKATLYRHLREG